VLYIAFAIYIIGIGIVLYFRPSVMFLPETSSWKEFGLGRPGSHTVFPFWLFTLAWAIISYALATIFSLTIAHVTFQSMPDFSSFGVQPEMNMNNNTVLTPISSAPNIPSPLVNAAPSISQSPGYYIIDTTAKNTPKYVYFGTTPPSYEQLLTYSR
jgi:hypothetical protein